MYVVADMFHRPAQWSDTEMYVQAYVAGALILVACLWLFFKCCRKTKWRLIAGAVAAVMALIAALAMREELRVARAERCVVLLHGALEQDIQDTMWVEMLGRRWVMLMSGSAWTREGNPTELVGFLRERYAHALVGPIIRLRNAVFGLDSPTEEQLAQVERIPALSMNILRNSQ